MKKNLIKKMLLMSHKSKEGHLGSSLSILDILFVVYKNLVEDKNSKFVLSKGHASLALYVVLDYFGLTDESLENFCKFDSKMGGHPAIILKGVECSTGSLGHGFPFSVGLAMAKKIKKEAGKIITIIGDGEANEGTIWESALLASHHKLNNLYCILDYNHSTDRALDLQDIFTKLQAFGWVCCSIDGHNEEEIQKSLEIVTLDKPIFILANTTKGKGIKIMENNPEWHHKSPNKEELNALLEELDSK